MSYLVSPFQGLTQLNRGLNRMFDEQRLASPYVDESDINWAPQVDLAESEEAFHLVADIPGVNPDDIEISLNNGILTIRGERNTKQKVNEKSCTRRERHRGTFLRQFNLPDSVDADTVKAKSAHGVLQVTIPKVLPAKPITVSVEPG